MQLINEFLILRHDGDGIEYVWENFSKWMEKISKKDIEYILRKIFERKNTTDFVEYHENKKAERIFYVRSAWWSDYHQFFFASTSAVICL